MKNTIIGAVRNQLRHSSPNFPMSYHSGRARLTASADMATPSSPGGSSGVPVHINTVWPSQYQYYFTGILPAEPSLSDPASLALFWRDIYLYDAVGGSCVDLMSNLPFSDFALQGVNPKYKKVYEDSISQLNLREMFTTISWAYLTDGFFCGTSIYDVAGRRFSDTMVHDALQCSVRTSPFFNRDPSITVTVSNEIARFLSSDSSGFNRRYLNTLPQAFQELLQEGRFELNPATTLFVPRKTMTDRPYVSFLHRLLPYYLIEKSLYRGTLTEIQRRQRAMTMITAGDADWVPQQAELDTILQQMVEAEYDNLGGWIATRNSVNVQDIRPAGDFLRFMDISDQLTPYKLRALGISEAFLGSEGVTFQAHESSYSMFLEGLNEFRSRMTSRLFYQRLFPMIAIINGFYKDKNKVEPTKDFTDYFYNASDRANLITPTLHWKKNLEADDESDMFEMLEKAAEHGVPIPIRRYMAAAGVDPDDLLLEMGEDVLLRQALEQVTGKDTSHEGDDYDLDAGYRRMPTIPMSKVKEFGAKIPFLSRFNGGSNEEFSYTRTGRRKAVPSVMQPEYRKRTNAQIAKISAKAKRDPNYRMELLKKNRSRGKIKYNLD